MLFKKEQSVPNDETTLTEKQPAFISRYAKKLKTPSRLELKQFNAATDELCREHDEAITKIVETLHENWMKELENNPNARNCFEKSIKAFCPDEASFNKIMKIANEEQLTFFEKILDFFLDTTKIPYYIVLILLIANFVYFVFFN